MVDFNLDDDGGPMISNDIDIVLQQIDILFDTVPRDMIDDADFGTRYDEYLYQLKVSNEGLRSTIIDDICSIDLRGFMPDVKVYFLQGTEQDIALIDITLTRNSERYEKTYKIS